MKIESKTIINRIPIEQIITKAMKMPLVKINRETFLTKELKGKCSEEQIRLAVQNNPAFAGIDRSVIDPIAKQVIGFETNKVSVISFAAGIPGGFAMIGTIPADLAQYFGFVLRIMQQLAYLYGFEQFDLDDNGINSDTMNRIMVFLGEMFGVQCASTGIEFLGRVTAQKVAKSLPQKPLTKGFIYPIVKKIAQAIGIHMNKQIYANGVSKIVPVIGGVASGGITYVTFKRAACRLQKSFSNLNLCDPEFYKNPDDFHNSDIFEDYSEESGKTEG